MSEAERKLDRVREMWRTSKFPMHVGIELVDMAPGRIDARIAVAEHHGQSQAFVHAGVITTLADHCAGAAGATLVPEGKWILTVEFKMNFMRPADAKALLCRAEVLKPGRTLTVAEASVHADVREPGRLLAKGLFTLAVVNPRADRPSGP